MKHATENKKENKKLPHDSCSMIHELGFTPTPQHRLVRGFTLIELLVVVAIVGLLASVILVATGNARIKSRDAKRLTDISQIKTGLDIYYSSGGGYPATAVWNTAQSGASELICNVQVVMKIPQDLSNSADPSFAYTYTQGVSSSDGCGGTVYNTYKVQFKTEAVTGLGPTGTYYLSPSGITTTAPF